MPGAKNQKKTQRRPVTRERVIDVAIQLTDKEGVGALTMRRLAQELGVEAMSLYYHVSNKDEILDAMVDWVFSQIEAPSPGDDWKPALRARTISAREVLLEHRWAITLMESRPNPGPATMTHHDSVLGTLRKGGFSLPMAAHAFSVIDGYLYGFVMQEEALPFETPEELAQIAAGILEAIPAEKYPHFREMIVDHALQPGYSYVYEFEFGLDLILDGLERAAENESSAD